MFESTYYRSKAIHPKNIIVLSHFSHVRLCDPMDCSCQAPLSLGFCRQRYWNGLPFPPPRDLQDPGIEPTSLDSCIGGGLFTTSTTGKPQILYISI